MKHKVYKMSAKENLASCIVDKLGKLWDKNELSDIKIVIDDVKFNCHIFHLSACSEIFRAQFKLEAKNSLDDIIKVTIRGIAPEIFKLILLSIYKGELTVNTDNMLDLWHASQHLQIDFLVNEVEQFISRNINDDNFFIIYKLAVELVSDRIRKSLQSYIAKHFEKISKTEEFLNLSYDFLLAIIGHDDLVLKSRDDLVSSVLGWIDYKPRTVDKTGTFQKGDVEMKENKTKWLLASGELIFKPRDELTYKVESSRQRKDKLGELMKFINLDNVSQDCLLTLLNNDDVIDCREARTIVRQAFTDRKDKTNLVRNIPVTNSSFSTVLEDSPVKEIITTKSSSSAVLQDSPKDEEVDIPEDFEDTIPIVVYLQTSFKAILAFMLDTRKTYSVPRNGLPIDGSMKNVYSYKNQLYILIGQSVDGKDVSSIFKFQLTGQWECLTEVPDRSHSFLFTDNYIYCVVEFQICRLNWECLYNSVWVCVYNAQSTAISFEMFENKFIISHTTETEIEVPAHLSDSRPDFNTFKFGTRLGPQVIKKNVVFSHITYLDTVTWESRDDKDWISNAKVSFKHVQSFDSAILTNPNSMKADSYLLTEQGLLLQVTPGSDDSLSVTKDENVFSTERKSQPIVGAVRHGKVLFLFVNQGQCVSDSTPLKLTSFEKIKVVHLVRSDSNCVPLKFPKQWLRSEV